MDDSIHRSASAPALRDMVASGEGQGLERALSNDSRPAREALRHGPERSLNAILELDLDNKVRWLSESWSDLTGIPALEVIGKPVGDLLVENKNAFADCVDAIRDDDSKSQIVKFSLRGRKPPVQNPQPTEPSSKTNQGPPNPDKTQQGEVTPITEDKPPQPTKHVLLEAQGMLIYDSISGKESHTMWMVKPAMSREITIDLPDVLVESLGIGAEILADYLNTLADAGVQSADKVLPPPPPVLCRICERQIPAWWFEKHSELCAQEHRAELDIQLAQESLNEQRSALVKVLDALEAQSSLAKRSSQDFAAVQPFSKVEYKGYPIGPSSASSSNPSSGRASPAFGPTRSRESSATGLGHHRRARSFAVRRPLARIVELVLDLCDTAMEISTPSIKDTKMYDPGKFRTQSPQSESRIQQVMQWQSPSAGTLEHEQGLALLCDESFQLAKSKVEAVFRHRRILEYSERIRMENELLVQKCIEAAIQKASRIAAGELSEPSSESEDEPEAETVMTDDEAKPVDTVKGHPITIGPENCGEVHRIASASPATVMGLYNSAAAIRHRRTCSTTSSKASSVVGGMATPRSYAGPSEPFLYTQRESPAVESDAGTDKDVSVQSSESQRREDSPNAEGPVGRSSGRQPHDPKRRSLVLPSLANQVRQQSPAGVPPSSPLRMAKARVTSGVDSAYSPVASPVLSNSEYASPIIRAQQTSRNHHRRGSSIALSDVLARPASPRLSGVVGNPQPRAVQTSIKDFEIIKPISKGAFGSVYLAKKKSTGDYYAIKVLKKADMVAKNQVTNVKAERAIMMWQGESDFVAKLCWTFSSKDYLYLVMEYLNGGDCASLIKVLGALPEDWTKKYIGEVVLCVQHLHSRQIVHRDLKPDNLLIDSKGHLKLTDFGLSRMGLIGRQKRAINAKPGDAPPDLLKTGPFRRAPSTTSSRSISVDYQSSQSPAQTPALTPAIGSELSQPSYFSLKEASREPSRRASAYHSSSGDSDALEAMFRRVSLAESKTPIEEETATDAESPCLDAFHPVQSNSSQQKTGTPPPSMPMPPPIMSLFDPEDSSRRFVGTPDYLAPETINGQCQDEMSDWWSLGCILFEGLYGRPPFNDDTPEKVFQNILARKIQWPSTEDDTVSEEAKDLMNKLMCLDPSERLGANKEGKHADGGEEIKAHPWFKDINWDTLREEEASFVPVSLNLEDTEYFDARGATMQNFAAEFQDEQSSPAQTPGADYPDRPHDALSRVKTAGTSLKRNLMPLHIPPHVRDPRSRRLSEPVPVDDFGNFNFKNLSVLEKANKDVLQKLGKGLQFPPNKLPGGTSSALVSPSPAPSGESSPTQGTPLRRTLSSNKGAAHRAQSPAVLNHQSPSPSRNSQPSSPMLVSFRAGPGHERRKTSSGSSYLSHQTSSNASTSLEQIPRLPAGKIYSNAPSPIKTGKSGLSQLLDPGEVGNNERPRSHTLDSREGSSPAYLRRSGGFDFSPAEEGDWWGTERFPDYEK